MKCPVCSKQIHYFDNEVSCDNCGYEDEVSDYHIKKLEAEVARLREFKEFVNMMIRRNLAHTCSDYEAIMAIDEKLLKGEGE